MISDDAIEAAVDWLRTNVNAAAKAKAERIYLEAFTKHLVATIMKEHVGSAAAQEREAWADKRVLDHLIGLKTAVERDCRMTFSREAAQAKLSAWQTQHATERALKL